MRWIAGDGLWVDSVTHLPAYTVHVRKLDGTPYTTTTIKINGAVIRSQLGPMSASEVEDHVRAFLLAPPASRLDDVAAFFATDKKSAARAARGGRKSPSVTNRGFIWEKE